MPMRGNLLLRCTVRLACLGLLLALACTPRGGKAVKPPALSPASAASEAMAMYDTNKDGKITPDEAPGYFGWMAALAGEDIRSASEQTRAALGWQPTGPGLIADLEKLEWV